MGISEIFYSLDIEIESSKQEIINYIYDNYVSKDKIKNLIKELEEIPQNQYIHISGVIDAFKELIKEE